jgi:putative ABC transport system permease protein
MIKNYLKTAWRSLTKNKTFSLINVAGLSIGMAACLLILQYVSFELSYDQFNRNVNELYRVYNDRYQHGKLIQHGTITYSAIGKAMQEDFPEVIDHCRVEPFGKVIVSLGTKKIGDQEVLAVDNSFLRMFSYPWLAGNQNNALKDPFEVVITASAACKIFDVHQSEMAALVGRVIVLGTDSMPYKIAGILKDVPENSHLQFDVLVSYTTMLAGTHPYKEADYDFTDSDFWHYIQLRQGTDYKDVEKKLAAFSDRHFHGSKVSGSEEKFHLQPLSRAHLYSDFEYEIGKTGSATVVWGLLIVAGLIILIAWVNYINLATAKSLERAKEVGVRKVAGATKGQLIRQFLTESFMINLIALLASVVLVLMAQNSFNRLVHHELSLSYLFTKGLSGNMITVTLLGLFVGGIFVSGFYPSFVLSSFQPILVLKGRFAKSGRGMLLRKALVIGQFSVTIVLIAGSILVYRQMRFLSRQDLGMDISQMLIIHAPELTNFDSTFIGRENSFTASLASVPGVLGASTSWNVPGGETGRSFHVRRSDSDPNVYYTTRHTGVSLSYFKIYGVKFMAGRDFTYSDFNPDFNKLHNIILNENATRLLGFSSPKNAIGKSISRGDRKWDVIGVIQNYHQKSLHFALEPTMYMPAYSTYSSISVKVHTGDLNSTIASIKNTYDSFFPGNLFDYYFLDEKFNQLYSDDQLFGKVFAIFAGFAICIASLGLLGLSIFATGQRTKEIGVRKVLGASVANIVLLLSRDFVRLVLLSILIAVPFAWYIMHGWLQNFAYRVAISWWIFLAAGVLAVGIALLTISIQSIRAALGNPVNSLRTE